MQKTTIIILIILLLWVIVCIMPTISLANNMEDCQYRVTAICNEKSGNDDSVYAAFETASQQNVIKEEMKGHTILGLKTEDRKEALAQYAALKSIPDTIVVLEIQGNLNNESRTSLFFEKYMSQKLQGVSVCTLPFSQTALRASEKTTFAAAGYPYLINWY